MKLKKKSNANLRVEMTLVVPVFAELFKLLYHLTERVSTNPLRVFVFESYVIEVVVAKRRYSSLFRELI